MLTYLFRMAVEMTTDYNETQWINQWTGATISPPNNQEGIFRQNYLPQKRNSLNFQMNLDFQLVSSLESRSF